MIKNLGFLSTSTDPKVTAGFGANFYNPSDPYFDPILDQPYLIVFQNSGGRDISQISVLDSEQERIVLPGGCWKVLVSTRWCQATSHLVPGLAYSKNQDGRYWVVILQSCACSLRAQTILSIEDDSYPAQIEF